MAAFAILDYISIETLSAVNAAIDKVHIDSFFVMGDQRLFVFVFITESLTAASPRRTKQAAITPGADCDCSFIAILEATDKFRCLFNLHRLHLLADRLRILDSFVLYFLMVSQEISLTIFVYFLYLVAVFQYVLFTIRILLTRCNSLLCIVFLSLFLRE